jgi:hypothetical protein
MDNPTTFIRWGPYTQSYDKRTGEYSLFRDADPNSIQQSLNPILKEPVSLFLSEVLKPSTVLSTPVAGLSKDRKPDKSVIGAAIAMMDQEVIRKVRSARDDRMALAILSLYDRRFGDIPDSEEWRVRLLQYFKLQSASPSKRPGPQSPKRAAIWEYIDSRDIGPSLRKSNSLRSRQRLALKIGADLELQLPEQFFGAGSKSDSDVMAVLRQFSQKKMSRKRVVRKPSRS